MNSAMKNIFKYIIILTATLFASTLAQAQVTAGYKNQNGVSTGKSVSGPNSDGTYTVTLETFATGTSTVTKTSTPVDVVLVLDVSGSMSFPKGTTTQISNNTQISYDTVANSDVSYFYRHNFGDSWEYVKIYTEEYNGRYYLYYDYGSNVSSNRKQYITSSGTSSSRPSTGWPDYYNITSPTQTIFTVSNNRPVVTAKESRMDALKPAVKSFIQSISYNAGHYKDSTDRDDHLDNRLSIIKFSDANITQALCDLTTVEGNESTLEAYVDGLVPGGGTSAGTGLELANTQLSNAAANSAKVVVFFTDGEPTVNYAAIGNTNNGGNHAYRAKHTYEASVFSIGLFTTSPSTTSNTWKFLNYVSSNYPNATATGNNYTTMNAGTGGSDQGFYKDASGDVDLTSIFNDISGSIGGSEEEIGTDTQIRDMVTSSFTVPTGTASALTVEVWKVDRNTQNWVKVSTNPTGITATIGKKTYPDELDGEGQPVKRDTVGVTGFDFSKGDTTEGAGDGNWVGIRYDNSTSPATPYYAGRKLVISFKVKEVDGATGGIGTAPNTAESGVYVKKEDGTYENVNPYEVPHTTLPVTIKITKNGLRHGESATFQIFKIAPKRDTLVSVTGLRDSVVMRYNPIGKPLPNEKEYAPQPGDDAHDILEGKGWEKWSKVILTNKGADKEAVTKILISLDPSWVYMVTEDDWSWSYTTTGTGEYQTTSTVEINPFRFTNTEKTGVPKHAEAVTINHFGYTIPSGEFKGKQEEHYKSSKTKF